MPRTRLNFVNPLRRVQIQRVSRQAVKRVGWHTQNLPGADLISGVPDQRGFRFFGINFDNFSAHQCFPSRLSLKTAKPNISWESSATGRRQRIMLPRQVSRLFQPAMKGTVHDRLRHIEGKHNALVKELRAAFSRGEPTTPGVCAIEGLRIVEEAIRSGVRIEAVFFSESSENKAERLLPQLGSQVETLLLPDKLFSSAVPSESPQGVAAMVRLKEH